MPCTGVRLSIDGRRRRKKPPDGSSVGIFTRRYRSRGSNVTLSQSLASAVYASISASFDLELVSPRSVILFGVAIFNNSKNAG